jgi:hypothetical protein
MEVYSLTCGGQLTSLQAQAQLSFLNRLDDLREPVNPSLRTAFVDQRLVRYSLCRHCVVESFCDNLRFHS